MAAVIAEPDAAKAATMTSEGEVTYFSIPVEKQEDTKTINPVDGTPDIILWGKATDGTLDSDLQIVDPDWSEKALKDWLAKGPALRVMHQAKRDPAGTGLDVRGHHIRALVAEPAAKHLVRIGALRDFSVGISNPDIRDPRDPSVRHLDPTGKAVNGVITGRDDGQSQICEVSLCDRGANFGSRFSMVKAAGDGTPEWVGKLLEGAVLAKTAAAAPKAYKTVSVDLPKSARISVSPAVLAKMNTMARRNAVPAIPEPAEPPAVTWVPDEDPLAAFKAAGTGEDSVLGKDHRTFTAEQRREHASDGTALADGSYPMPDADAVRRAAILIRSKHGNWKAAAKLLARRAKSLKIPNPLKQKVAEAEAPKAGKCACAGSGMVDGKPCTSCKKGKKKANALFAKALAGLDVPAVTGTAEKKQKVMCGHCGAKQNAKHVHCPECGNALMPGAMPIAKNHDFVCLGCGKDPLDKGEQHCPGCGKENPGYLPHADHKIPANKAAKERVNPDSAAKAKKGKKPKKGKGEAFGGSQARPFGQDADDAEPDKDKKAKKTARPAAAKKKNGGKGRSPAVGAVPQSTEGLPSHREPDGMPVEAFEADTSLSDGDCEMKAIRRHKSLGIDPDLAVLHDLTCAAFTPADVAKCLPFADFATIDTNAWQVKALEAASGADMGAALEKYNELAMLSRDAITLKTADPQVLQDLRLENHAAFLAANKTFRDATPGPGSFPAPSHVMPGAFNRPYISAGHAAASPQHEGPRSFAVTEGSPMARDFNRDYLTAGHAADSPANDTPRHLPPAANMEAGQPSRVFYQNSMRDNARQALTAMHDHICRMFPDVCPMSPDMGSTQKPAPEVPQSVGGPVPHHSGKAAKAKARKAAKGKTVSKRRKASTPRAAAAELPSVVQPLEVDATALSAAVKAATAPLLKHQRAQDKQIRKLARVASAIADQRDTSAAPFRGSGAAKSASPALAGPVTMTQSAEQAQVSKYMRLRETWRTTSIPEEQEACWNEMQAMLGTAPLTGPDPNSGLLPMNRLPMN